MYSKIGRARAGPGRPWLEMDELGLERRQEALGNCIVPTLPGRDSDWRTHLQQRPELGRGDLTAADALLFVKQHS